MKVNGSLYGIEVTSQLNEYGEVSGEGLYFTEPVPCLVQTNNDSFNGAYEDGEFRTASFTVLIEERDFPYRRVHLERKGEDMGDYRVISLTNISSLNRISLSLARD